MKNSTKKLLSFAAAVMMSVSAMAFTFTASAEYQTNYTYNDITYEIAFINIPTNTKTNGTDSNYVAYIGTNNLTNAYCNSSNDTTVDVYGTFTVENFKYENCNVTINIMPGAKVSITNFSTISSTLKVNNYGASELNLPKGVIVNDILSQNQKNGNTTAQVTSETLAAPTYTVTIPKEINFGTIQKTSENSADKYAYTPKNTVSVLHSNLYENEKQISVKIAENAGTLTSGTNTLAYEFVTKNDTTDTKIDLTKPVITATPTEQDTAAEEIFEFYGKTDCSKIKVEGTFSQTVQFTVEMTDKGV